jgi:hypothetical protein
MTSHSEPPTPERGPERQRLADAIAARTVAEQDVEAAHCAIARAHDAVTEAETRLSDAKAAAEASGRERAMELAEAAAAGTALPARAASRVRAAVADAEDELDAARGAVTRLEGRLADAEDGLRAAENMVVAAADAVLRGVAGHVLADACAAAEKLQRARVLLRFMQRPEAAGRPTPMGRQPLIFGDDDAARRLGPERAHRRARADTEATQLRDEGFAQTAAHVERHLAFALQGVHETEQRWTLAPELEAWREARAALMADPDVSLPE